MYSGEIRKELRQKAVLDWGKGGLTSWSDVSFLECELNSCPVKRWNGIDGYVLLDSHILLTVIYIIYCRYTGTSQKFGHT